MLQKLSQLFVYNFCNEYVRGAKLIYCPVMALLVPLAHTFVVILITINLFCGSITQPGITCEKITFVFPTLMGIVAASLFFDAERPLDYVTLALLHNWMLEQFTYDCMLLFLEGGI